MSSTVDNLQLVNIFILSRSLANNFLCKKNSCNRSVFVCVETELPLYLLLGILSGGVSVTLVKGSAYATTLFENVRKTTGIPAGFLPPVGGLAVGVIALAYPEILYWGFENVDVLLESRPWVRGPSVELLLQLVGVKVIATSLCRGSGLVGGMYAPSLFIGAALGSAYGSIARTVFSHVDPSLHLEWLKVAAPQAYALVNDGPFTSFNAPLLFCLFSELMRCNLWVPWLWMWTLLTLGIAAMCRWAWQPC